MAKKTKIVNEKIKKYLQVRGQYNSFAYLDMLDEVPHDGQIEILRAYEEKIPPSEDVKIRGEMYGVDFEFEYKYSTIVAACGRRFGKSKFASWLGAMELTVPYSQVLLVSGVKKNCEIIFQQVREFCIQWFGPDCFTIDRQKEMELEIKSTKARLVVASVENAESRLGNAISLIIVDEAKLFDKQTFEQLLEPMLADYYPYGRSILISSPDEGWFETYYDYGQAGLGGSSDYEKYWSINLPTASNPTISPAFLAKKKATLPPDIYAQEYEGKFNAKAGSVFSEFKKERNVRSIEHYPYLRDWIDGGCVVVHSVDPGWSHCFGGVYFVYVDEIDTFIVFGEYNKNKITTPVHAKNFEEYEREYIGREPDVRYCDPASAQTIGDFVEHNMMFNLAEKPLRESIQGVNNFCYQTSMITGESRLIVISEFCPELIRQLSSVKWKVDAANQTREAGGSKGVKPFAPDKDLHTDWDVIDALRYGLYTFGKNMLADIKIMEIEAEGLDEEALYEQNMAALGYVRM
jgi:hypothetical protein